MTQFKDINWKKGRIKNLPKGWKITDVDWTYRKGEKTVGISPQVDRNDKVTSYGISTWKRKEMLHKRVSKHKTISTAKTKALKFMKR
jgi:hypothetical protein